MDLSGQTAIVTGAGRGLGRAFASALAGAGAQVVVTSRSESELRDVVRSIELLGGTATAIAGDVTDRAAVEALVAHVEAHLGPVELLINNAGAIRALGSVADVDPDDWWRELEINLRGPELFMHALLPRMIQRGRGRVINVASAAGLNPIADHSAYVVSKTALIRLTEIAARETQAQGVRLFAIHPGTVRTPMLDDLVQSAEMAQRAPQLIQFFKDLYAQDRLEPISGAIDLVLLLASGQADALTGCFLSVRDDVPALIQQATTIQKEGRRRLGLRE